MSMSCLYSREVNTNAVGSTGSLASPMSSGYFSDGEENEEVEEKGGRRGRRERRRGRRGTRENTLHGDDNHGKKCVIM